MSNFIREMFIKDILRVKAESKDSARVRLQNVSWPSEASATVGPFTVGECKRALFYKVIGIEPSEEMSVRGRSICDAGLMYEDYHIERFKAIKLYYDSQYRIEFETNTKNKVVITGKIDVIINDDGVLKAIEIKSVSGFKAQEVFGSSSKTPFPFAHNLMQAMLYKYWSKNTEQGQRSGIKEVYLMYVNRSDGSTCFFEVDLDDKGYPIITAFDQSGKELYKMALANQNSYSDLLSHGTDASTEQSHIAELHININDIFSSFDFVYEHAEKKQLPEPDYKVIYSTDDLELEAKSGRLTRRKLSMLKKSGETYSDYKCTVCSYKKRCLSDSGIHFNI